MNQSDEISQTTESPAVTLRPYSRTDDHYLENIIRQTWQYDRFCSPKTAQRLSHLYLISCLANQTFTRTALADGVPVGIIMAKNCGTHRTPLRLCARQTAAAAVLCSCREGRAIAKAFSGISQIDQELLRSRGRKYAGELAFFAVDESRRGLGIGKRLFQSVLHYMKSQGISSFYLYTDSSCNYGFYEHQGMIRCGHKPFEVPLGIQNSMDFYLYDYTIEDNV